MNVKDYRYNGKAFEFKGKSNIAGMRYIQVEGEHFQRLINISTLIKQNECLKKKFREIWDRAME